MSRQAVNWNSVAATVEGVADVERMFADARKAFSPKLIQNAILPAAFIIRDQAKRNVPPRHGKHPVWTREGSWPFLKDSIFATRGKATDGSVIAGVDIKKSPEGYWLEFGTSPHPILPKRKPALWVVFHWVTRVAHPGISKTNHKFFRPAINSTKGAVTASLIDGLTRLLSRTVKPVYGNQTNP